MGCFNFRSSIANLLFIKYAHVVRVDFVSTIYAPFITLFSLNGHPNPGRNPAPPARSM